MYVTLITDCADANAHGRQSTRIQALFGITPSFVPISGTLDETATLQASGNVVDVLDAGKGFEGVVLANVAPRQGEEKHWGNGTPFGYFWYEHTLVCTTVSGSMLALPARLGLIDAYRVMHTEGTLERMAEAGVLSKELTESIAQSQFRSFDFLPRVAHWIQGGGEPVSESYTLPTFDDPMRVWSIDNFGNIKTTARASDIQQKDGKVFTKYGALPFVRSLKDVADGQPAVILGSSGIGSDRFVELVVQGGRACDVLHARVGDVIFE
jgi:hypothetical protein